MQKQLAVVLSLLLASGLGSAQPLEEVGEQATFSSIAPHEPTKGSIHHTLPSGREFLLNVPLAYDHDVPHPLVLSFHGAGGNSYRQEHLTQLSDPSLRIADLPFLVAYPQGVNNSDWNMTHIWKSAPYSNTSVDDVQFVKDIITSLSSRYSIDLHRIYANGKSNGGGFTSYLACRPDTSLLFAAFAPVSPALYQEGKAFSGCKPSRDVPILHSHGYEDPITPFYGGEKEGWRYGREPDVRVWRARWARRNGCLVKDDLEDNEDLNDVDGDGDLMGNGSNEEQPELRRLPKPDQTTYPHDNVTEQIWQCRAPIKALSIEGLGHAWPTTEGLDAAGRPLQYATFNFTSQHLVQFYTDNPLPKEYVGLWEEVAV